MEVLLSNPIFFFTTLALVLSIFTVPVLKRKLSKRKKKYPPIAGTVLHQLRNFHRVFDYMADLAAKHKTYRLLAPFRSEIYTSDPANAGPRICLGKGFAYRQMKILLAVLLGCFVFKMSDENRVVTYRTMITLHIDGGLEVQVFQR